MHHFHLPIARQCPSNRFEYSLDAMLPRRWLSFEVDYLHVANRGAAATAPRECRRPRGNTQLRTRINARSTIPLAIAPTNPVPAADPAPSTKESVIPTNAVISKAPFVGSPPSAPHQAPENAAPRRYIPIMTPSQPKFQNSSPAAVCPVEVVAELSSDDMPRT